MKYNLVSKYDRAKYLEDARRLVERGEQAEREGKSAFGAEQKQLKPPQSGRQLRFAFVCIGYFAAEYGISKYEAEWDYFKDKVNRDIFHKTKLNKKGESIPYVRHMDELDMGELSLAITRWRNFCSFEYQIYIPDSTDYAFMLHAEKIIEENKEFL